MKGNLEIRDPKRISSAESPDVSETQAGAQVAKDLQANEIGLADDAIAHIGQLINKYVVMRLRYESGDVLT